MPTTIKVKITCFWEDSQTFHSMIRRFAFGANEWKNLEFVTHDNYDRLVILTRPNDDCTYDPRKAITILTEPPESPNHKPHGTSQIIPVYLTLPFWREMKEMDLSRITRIGIRKRKLLSSVTSELCFMPGHRKRLELLHLLDISSGLDLSVWGRSYGLHLLSQLHSYRGQIDDKYQALWGYRYHFACENSFVDDYYTEKIFDPIVAECLCFYDGCRNLEDFIDERAFFRIDVLDPGTAMEKIMRSISDNEWKKRIPYIRQQKERLLYHLNPLNIIWMALNGKDVYKQCRI